VRGARLRNGVSTYIDALFTASITELPEKNAYSLELTLSGYRPATMKTALLGFPSGSIFGRNRMSGRISGGKADSMCIK